MINKEALRCPYCGEKVPVVYKFFMDARYKWYKCRKCGEKIFLPKWKIAYNILIAALLCGIFYKYRMPSLPYCIVILLWDIWFHIFVVPIIKEEQHK